jgi:hypothetical protein
VLMIRIPTWNLMSIKRSHREVQDNFCCVCCGPITFKVYCWRVHSLVSPW